jgi:hypothetical protein
MSDCLLNGTWTPQSINQIENQFLAKHAISSRLKFNTLQGPIIPDILRKQNSNQVTSTFWSLVFTRQQDKSSKHKVRKIRHESSTSISVFSETFTLLGTTCQCRECGARKTLSYREAHSNIQWTGKQTLSPIRNASSCCGLPCTSLSTLSPIRYFKYFHPLSAVRVLSDSKTVKHMQHRSRKSPLPHMLN